MEEIEVGGKIYQLGRLSAMEQFHVGRKLLPLHLSGPDIIAELSKMSTEDAEYVINTCLAVCKRKQGTLWAPVYSRAAGRMMFDDMTGEDLFRIMMETARSNKVVDFFTSGGQTSPAAQPLA